MGPLVSVVIPTYNREATIMRALDSVLAQTYADIEVIIVDDASTDSTVQLVNGCEDGRVRLIRMSENGGANAARNAGIRAAKGEYVAFQDSDDEWLENKLERQMAHMLKSGAVASFCPYISFYNGQTRIVPEQNEDREQCGRDVMTLLRKYNVVSTPTLLVRADVFSEIGLFDEEIERLQDYEFVIRLVKRFPIDYIDEPLVRQYRTEKSITNNREILAGAYKKILEKHMDFLNVEYIALWYLHACEHSDKGLQREDIDGLVSVFENKKTESLKARCHQTIIRYLYEQYDGSGRVLNDSYQLFVNQLKTGGFAIYGAGEYGRRAYEDLKREGYIPKCFLVTAKNGEEAIDDVPVVALAECEDDTMPVIVAVASKTQKELIRNLLDKGMNRFCIYPFFY